ncbi:NDP-sugar epimerase, includes UDP-GlcNAc-inverting 4,6-dehydratase FlaA1 and capsular polysaccharide biosynthesis protein EpsC [Robiginitalea myxolifaciens]|uniref:NDP-sugar epimerase, includes UDP-GlcNAc-inverting 4,6-dehydratase FlaA1 and capsular polysaccharide biosynthesis protein EpsC n=1 Tax=Robiginitalea myxolifaciens TaxID=400055 RepID=A0A1I6H1N8_9FLAO|nr:nucleoside-diphosphate sugar epimerase/dehydratase [Robiginitalea myxolifaciens]SFR48363.1 NDP-sugar epimerase, includes UDP-GlcNAc-inverting 4,6-dehydratase FlaA1 and capsular polysaccharide biosynthesis protein EpsC [Robiginitalea myxolifaciens]
MIKNYIISNSHRYASRWLVLAIDVLLISVAFILSYLIRFNLTWNFETDNLWLQLPIVALIGALSFLITGSYKGVVRHTGVRDVYNIFNAICVSSIFTIFMVIFNRQLGILVDFTIPLSIIIIHSLIGFIALTASRYVFKSLFHSFVRKFSVTRNVLIYGAGEAGILTYNALTSHSASDKRVFGYIDDDNKKVGKSINGVRVYGTEILNRDFMQRNDIDEIIVSINNIEQHRLREIVEGLVDFQVQVKIVPPVEDWINGELKLSQIKQVQIEDLLNRTPINIRKSRVSNELKDQVIMVTGGAGSIGSEIVRQIANYDYKALIIIDQAESPLYDLQQELKQNGFHNFVPIVADIRDKNRMNSFFQEHQPNIVFHAAAYKHVPLMEYNAYEAIKINVAGTKVLADLALTHKVDKFVFVSTDKAVNPTNVMGATKRIAEMYISCMHQEHRTKFITTRFGNVLGSNGSVIPLFRRQIENGGPLTVTHKEITRYFMTIPEASQLVLEAAAMGKGGEIFIFDMGESVKIFDLARNMIKLSGLRYPDDIDIKITGLRPGEKLYEELLANGENTLPTYHKKIMISKVRELDYALVRSKIDELCISNMFFNGDTVRLMKEIVPEYVSHNSEFCKLDSNGNEVALPEPGKEIKAQRRTVYEAYMRSTQSPENKH